MAQNHQNPGQFGVRSDTEKQAHKGGLASSGSFTKGSTKAKEAGHKGGKATAKKGHEHNQHS